MRSQSLLGSRVDGWTSAVFLKLAAVPLAVLILFLVYRFLPNGKPPLKRVIPAAIGVGLLLELLKYVNILIWPRFQPKLAREYGVFQNSVTLIFLSFISSLLVLGGAEWAARGHRLDRAPSQRRNLMMLAVVTGRFQRDRCGVRPEIGRERIRPVC